MDLKIKSNRMQNTIISVVVIIIIIALIPPIYNMFKNASRSTVRNQASGAVDIAETLYIELNLKNEVGLPFKMEFTENGYKVYENNIEITIPEELVPDVKGEMPTGGDVVIDRNGDTIATDLIFGRYTCDSIKGEVTCED